MGRSELILAACFVAGVLVGGTSLRAGDRPAPDAAAPEESRWEVRQKIVQLLELNDDRLLAELEKWPRFQKMDLGHKGRFLERIDRVRMERHQAAEREAQRLGLQLADDRKAAFERQYWQRREEIARQLWKETEGQRKALREKMEKDLKAEFASKEG